MRGEGGKRGNQQLSGDTAPLGGRGCASETTPPESCLVPPFTPHAERCQIRGPQCARFCGGNARFLCGPSLTTFRVRREWGGNQQLSRDAAPLGGERCASEPTPPESCLPPPLPPHAERGQISKRGPTFCLQAAPRRDGCCKQLHCALGKSVGGGGGVHGSFHAQGRQWWHPRRDWRTRWASFFEHESAKQMPYAMDGVVCWWKPTFRTTTTC